MKLRQGVLAILSALLLGASAAPAQGAVTLGQLAPGTPINCTNPFPFDILMPIVSSGNSYVVPSTVQAGTVTAWSTQAQAGANQALTMKIWRTVPSPPNTYQVVGHDGPRPLNPSVLNTFSGISIPVKAGDILGLNDGTNDVGCLFSSVGEVAHPQQAADTPDGGSLTFTNFGMNTRLNITATVEPSNTFTFGKTTLNKKKGTATVLLNVPNPGEVTVSGKGVKGSSASTAVAVQAGTAKVTIRAKGKNKRKLNDVGKTKVKPNITYTPTGGVAISQIRKLKLKKNR